MFKYDNNKRPIKDVAKLFLEKKLVVDESYQRRSVWDQKDKIRLIETVLLNLIMPEIFFWPYYTNPETGESVIHIVDGQQRVKAICEFLGNEYALEKRHLLNKTIQDTYGDKKFEELPPDIKTKFWNYPLLTIDIDPEATREDIVEMFRRLNLTDFSLNSQEKRNSLSGDFAVLARDLSNLLLWEKYSLFYSSDIKRMRDVEFCGTLILLWRQGIIDQTDQKALNNAYEDLQTGYKDIEKDKNMVTTAASILEELIQDKGILKFARKKVQMYSLFSVIFYMIRENIKITPEMQKQLAEFVRLYDIFRNNMEIPESANSEEKNIFDLLKKYKLASSEGLNKLVNRTIRYNVLKEFLFGFKSQTIHAQESLYKKMEQLKAADEAETEELEDF